MTIFSCRFHLETCIEKMRKVVGYLVPLVFIRLWMVCSLCACIYNTHSRYSQPCQNDGPPCCPFSPLPSLPLVKPSLLLRPYYSLPCPQIPGNEMPCQAISYDDVLTSRLSRVLWTRLFSLLQSLYIKIFQQATLIDLLHVTPSQHRMSTIKTLENVYWLCIGRANY